MFPSLSSAIAFIVKSRLFKSSSSPISGSVKKVKPAYPLPELRSVLARAYSSPVSGLIKTGKSFPTGVKPLATISFGELPTTTQSFS